MSSRSPPSEEQIPRHDQASIALSSFLLSGARHQSVTVQFCWCMDESSNVYKSKGWVFMQSSLSRNGTMFKSKGWFFIQCSLSRNGAMYYPKAGSSSAIAMASLLCPRNYCILAHLDKYGENKGPKHTTRNSSVTLNSRSNSQISSAPEPTIVV